MNSRQPPERRDGAKSVRTTLKDERDPYIEQRASSIILKRRFLLFRLNPMVKDHDHDRYQHSLSHP